MTADAAADPRPFAGALGRLMRAGLLTGLVDGLFSSVLAAGFYGSSVARLFQGVASTLLGPEALDGGMHAALIGVLMHFGVAFGWSAVFLLIAEGSARLRRVLAAPHGVTKVAAVYGPLVWLVMSLAVIPLLTSRPTAFTIRWWIQLVGHFPFVGLPIVAMIARAPRTAS
ncbi:MAG TPA: hypothetical protein VFN96_08395 [Gemmatimonadales bacterium]|nr:hypothetical protein [Gemmatimonadales bacterium]